MSFPIMRMQRLRLSSQLRDFVREVSLNVDDLVLPLFIRYGVGIKKPIVSMPGCYQLSIDQLAAELEEIKALKIRQILLFGIPATKDAIGSEACSEQGLIPAAIRMIKSLAPELLVITDVCFCEYTDHGHCGMLTTTQTIDNDKTLDALAQQAVCHAKAGADVIAPSGMMDGMVQAIRKGLDQAGYKMTPILSYAVKYASSLYGPFREAAEGAPQFGDRRAYQMDYANINEALRECALDVAEGADMLMVKPAHAYLDVIHRVKQAYPALPLGAYHTSGEYAMIKAAAEKGWLDERAAVMEVLMGIRRAGADFVITYYAKQVATWLAQA